MQNRWTLARFPISSPKLREGFTQPENENFLSQEQSLSRVIIV